MRISSLLFTAVSFAQLTCLLALPVAPLSESASLLKRGPGPKPRPAPAHQAAPKSAPHPAPACAMRNHGRSLFARGGDPTACEDIHIQLGTVKETIKAGTPNLGHGANAMNNNGVYKIDKWGNMPGPHIAKAFVKHEDMQNEAATLLKMPNHHIASGEVIGADGKKTPWLIMKHAPGAPLSHTPEFKQAVKKGGADCEKYLKEKHGQIADSVQRVHRLTNAAHGDIKESNIHFEHHADGSSTAHLLDFGQMFSDVTVKRFLDNLKMPTTTSSANAHVYGLTRARQIYPKALCHADSVSG